MTHVYTPIFGRTELHEEQKIYIYRTYVCTIHIYFFKFNLLTDLELIVINSFDKIYIMQH